MTLTNIEIKALADALNWLSEQESKSARFSFRVGHTLTVLDPVVTTLEKAQREVYLKYVKMDEGGQPVLGEGGVVEFEDTEALEKALAELFDAETELPVITPLTLDDFEQAEIVPTGRQMAALTPIIADPQ